jgi:hypothetical protein
MNRTVRLTLPNAAGRAPVAGQVALALAIACGTGPLAGERLRRAVEGVAAAAEGALTMDAVAERGRLELALTASPDDGWSDRALAQLRQYDARRTPAGISVRVQRAPLHRAPDV